MISKVRKRKELILLRRKNLLSQYEVACRLGISQSQYSLIENGYVKPSEEATTILAELLGINPEYFADDEKG